MEHVDEGGDGFMDIVFLGGFGVAPAHFLPFDRMVQSVIDAGGQSLGILGREETVLVQREL